jgi:citrate synthase
VRLLELADGWGLSGFYTAITRQVEGRLQEQAGLPLPMNVDAALAALVSDLGLHWRYARAIFVIARSAGLAAHVAEELEHGKPMEFAIPTPVHYTGPADRDLPPSEEQPG